MRCKAQFQYRDSLTGSCLFRFHSCLLEEHSVDIRHEALIPTFHGSINEERRLLETTSFLDLPHGILTWDDSVSYKDHMSFPSYIKNGV